MNGSSLGRWHSSIIFDSDIVNKEMLSRFVDAVLIFVDDIEFENLKRVWAWVCGF